MFPKFVHGNQTQQITYRLHLQESRFWFVEARYLRPKREAGPERGNDDWVAALFWFWPRPQRPTTYRDIDLDPQVETNQ